MRVLLSTTGSRGDVEPLGGLAVRLRALAAEARVCAPQDFAARLAEVGVPLGAIRLACAPDGGRGDAAVGGVCCLGGRPNPAGGP